MDIAKVGDQLPALGITAAGLTLVFLGFLFASWDAYSTEQQDAVRTAYLKKGWLAFWGVIAALLAMLFGLIGIAEQHSPLGFDVAGLLCMAAWCVLIIIQSTTALQGMKP